MDLQGLFDIFKSPSTSSVLRSLTGCFDERLGKNIVEDGPLSFCCGDVGVGGSESFVGHSLKAVIRP